MYSKNFIDSFVDAYRHNVACASDKAVRAFLQDWEGDMGWDQLRDRHEYSSNIFDALGMFEAGMAFQNDLKMKTSELTGAALDWAVTKCEGHDASVGEGEWGMWGWATSWAQGGPLIERLCIDLQYQGGETDVWGADMFDAESTMYGDTPLIAAMRCYVASVMGDEVELPKEISNVA